MLMSFLIYVIIVSWVIGQNVLMANPSHQHVLSYNPHFCSFNYGKCITNMLSTRITSEHNSIVRF